MLQLAGESEVKAIGKTPEGAYLLLPPRLRANSEDYGVINSEDHEPTAFWRRVTTWLRMAQVSSFFLHKVESFERELSAMAEGSAGSKKDRRKIERDRLEAEKKRRKRAKENEAKNPSKRRNAKVAKAPS